MHLISTSFHVASPLFEEVTEIMRRVYIPMLEKSGLFTEIRMLEILLEVDPEMRSFAVQMACIEFEKAIEWMQGEPEKLFAILHKRYGEKLVLFTTPMKEI